LDSDGVLHLCHAVGVAVSAVFAVHGVLESGVYRDFAVVCLPKLSYI
jgi:hypothetical protein